jgi:flagellar protein FliO/FliZ
LFELVLRIGFSLSVVLGLMWLLARMIRRPLGSGRRGGTLAVLDRQQLSRGAAVTVIRVADRAMILGVTDQQVSLLGESHIEDFERHPAEHRDAVTIDGGGLPAAHPAASPERLDRSLRPRSTWASSALDFLRDRTSRQ